jgi:RHS repeat-associated protein
MTVVEGYTGQERDGTGLDSFGARSYLSAYGRWGSVDARSEQHPAWSPYAYVLGNPLKLVDPDGRQVEASWLQFSQATQPFRQLLDQAERLVKEEVPALVNKALTYTDVNDVAVLMTTLTRGEGAINVDGTPATVLDRVAAATGMILPIVSGSAAKQGLEAGVEAVAKGVGRAADRPVGIPSDWLVMETKKGGGTQYVNPNNPHDRVRVMPGNPNSPNTAQKSPYVKRQINGKFYDTQGRVVPGDSPDAHIPLDQFKFEE